MSGGVGYNVTDPASQGYPVERDERAGLLPGEHAVKRAVSIDGVTPEGAYKTKDGSRGDVQPRLLWANGTREIPSYSGAWAATVTASDKDPKKTGKGGAAPGFASAVAPDGSDPFGAFFGAQSGSSGLFGVQGAFGGIAGPGTTGFVGNQFGGSFGQFGAQPAGSGLVGVQGAFGGVTPGQAPPTGATTQGGTIAGGAGASKSVVFTGGGGPGGAQLMHVRPIRARGTIEDDRYEHIIAPDRPVWSSRFPKGWTGVMLPTSREEGQDEVFIPGGHALVASSAVKADHSLTTAVVGTDPKTDKVDPLRRALLGDFMRIIHRPAGIPANALSWHIGIDPTRSLVSGFVTDYDYGDGLKTVQRNDPTPLVHGHVVHNGLFEGPFLVGPSNDRHAIHKDADGFVINPLHVNAAAMYRFRDDNVRDGPLAFEKRDMPLLEHAPNRTPVHLCWSDKVQPFAPSVDPGAPVPFGSGHGAWAWYAETVLETEGGGGPPPPPGGGTTLRPPPGGGGGGGNPPPKPPKPGPGQNPHPNPGEPGGHPDPSLPTPFGPIEEERRKRTGRVGPTRLETRNKAIATTGMELAAPTFLLRPAGWGCGTEDIRNSLSPSPEARDRRRRDPVIGGLHTAWKKPGGACNPWGPEYTTQPGAGPYPGGTASGIAAWLPPEVTLADHPTGYAPGGVTKSSLVMGALKGSVLWGSGLPNPTTALLESGYTWGAHATTGAMEFHERNAVGAVASTSTLPKRTGTILQAPSALVSGQLVKADANGDIVDVGNAAAARTLLGLGTIATESASDFAKLADDEMVSGSWEFAVGTARLYLNTVIPDTAYFNAGDFVIGTEESGHFKFATSSGFKLEIAPEEVTGADRIWTVPDEGGDQSFASRAHVAAGYQPLDSDLTAIAALATTSGGRSLLTGNAISSNTIPKGNGSGGLADTGLTDDGTTVSTSRAVAATGTTTLTTVCRTTQNLTAANGGTAISTVNDLMFINASALTTNYSLTLPNVATFVGRRVTYVVTAGGAGSTLTFTGGDAGADDIRDGSNRTAYEYASNGTNWYRVK